VRGDADQLAPPVRCVAGLFHVTEVGQAVDGLARGLFGDAQAVAGLGGGGAIQPDGLQREAVRRAQVRVAAAGQLGVQLVDDRAEPAEQEQRQLEPECGRLVV
jgi:hypothetical protein